MKHKPARIAIFTLALFGALTAIAGGVCLLTGVIAPPLDSLLGTPFADYTVPGLVLAIIVGGSMLLAAVTIFSGREVGVLISACAGLVMIGFEIVEVVAIDRSGGSSLLFGLILQAFYFLLGVALFWLAAFLWMTEFRGHHLPTRHVSHI